MISKQYFLHHFDKKNFRILENFSIGDLIKVGFSIQENEKKRIQFFEGMIIAINGHYLRKKITLRKLGIERVFCCQNIQLKSLKTLKLQKFRKSKLYYLRNILGKKFYKI
uniref:Ribosomal protein L19 n=1 Tax=Boodleopsis sp. FL1161 TaxID=2364084 RepID=A0A386AZ97_9CHLO|nr:ribosomal protein L19 [Boodleopsis sp. FL1161]